MTSDVEFPTHSKYIGEYVKVLHEMEGFGQYTFPDLSEYRGSFKKGKFHGYGHIKLAPPYSMVFQGFFENGNLVKIDEIMFKDGLKMDFTIDDGKLDSSKWKYCTERDRRYTEEILLGLEGVGIDWRVTQTQKKRDLSTNAYDAEEGILLQNGFLIRIPPPFANHHFIGCTEEEKWIKEHCRTSFKINPLKMDKTIVNDIVNANIDAARRRTTEIGDCVCQVALKQDYFAQMCAREFELLHRDVDDNNDLAPIPHTDSSQSHDSFNVESLIDNEVENFCKLELETLDYNDMEISTTFDTAKSK